MNLNEQDNLEKDLERLTRWDARPGDAEPWRAAVADFEASSGAAEEPVIGWLRPSWRSWRWLAAAMVFVVGAVTIHLAGGPRERPDVDRQVAASEDSIGLAGEEALAAKREVGEVLSYARPMSAEFSGLSRSEADSAKADLSSSPASLAENLGSVRHVARRVELELKVPVVADAARRAEAVVRGALGEYVERSTLDGSGPGGSASLTLRVLADRCAEATDQLRSLGTVVSERSAGDDVTDRVVDLEARARNESRVEAELLALVESRRGAPLKEIMEVRSELQRVREELERLQAQRDGLGALVSLATITVRIAHDEGAATGESSRGSKASEKLRGAWGAGTDALTSSAAWCIELVVGGLIWWVLLALVVAVVWTRWPRPKAQSFPEPAPRVSGPTEPDRPA